MLRRRFVGSSKPLGKNRPSDYGNDDVGKEEDGMNDHADHESRATPVEPVVGAFRCATDSMSHLKMESDLTTGVGQFLVVTPPI